jgi:hypothetical protein
MAAPAQNLPRQAYQVRHDALGTYYEIIKIKAVIAVSVLYWAG